MHFCFVLCSLIRTFALDHQHKTSEEGWCDIWVNKITALADYSVHLET